MFVVVTGVVRAWVGPTSEPEDRRENASEVVGKEMTARRRSNEQNDIFIVLPPSVG